MFSIRLSGDSAPVSNPITSYRRFHMKGDQETATPWSLFDIYNKRFGPFTIDVCASKANTKCRIFISKETTNALKVHWPYGSVAWMNPPFGGLYDWMQKAYLSARDDGCTVVCLVPCWTSDRWFHQFCSRAEIIFLRDRVHFVDADGGDKGGFPTPIMIVVFRPDDDRLRVSFAHHAMKG